jgi:cell division protease FtsH
MQAGGNKALSFGKSKAKLLNNQQKRVTFKDVAGVDEPKEELEEIIEFLKDPQKFQKLGGKIPKGVLMMGPPGTGKTLLAKAVAGEANVPFFSISGSDFVEMFVGVGASRVRDLFEQGKKNAPCIIFIDEIDAVGRHRGAGLGGGHDEREQTLNQLLVEMDGFESNDGVILMASTNRPDVLDPALLRPGRFDRQVVVSYPDVRGREGILKVHTRKIPLDEGADINIIARGTPGFTGADLANLVNEAALIAARANKKVVTLNDLESAKDKVMMGPERRSMVISDKEKRLTAIHEAGHTIVGINIPESDPVHKVTIIPRGRALGVTYFLPEQDILGRTKEELLAMIANSMGGRIAEDLFIGRVTTGASNDIEKATEIARSMVCQYGMSELGPLAFGKKEEQIFLGREIAQHRDFSEDTAIKIDKEVNRIVSEQYARAQKIIEENRQGLERLTEALLEFARRPRLMGIVNVTPDSFSDGGHFLNQDAAVEQGVQLVEEGADLLDIGGESTRPYAERVDAAEEMRRVLPVFEGLAQQVSVPLSIDTSKAAVAEAAIAAGAEIVNDVTGLAGDPAMIPLAVRTGVGVCAMHMQGTPQTMQDDPQYNNVVEDVFAYLKARRDALLAAGVKRQRICLDPGVGFGKTHQHNITLMAHCGRFHELGCPVLIGHSRKGFLGKILGDKEANRDVATAGAALVAAGQGIQVLRVHNVRVVREALLAFEACGGIDGLEARI